MTYYVRFTAAAVIVTETPTPAHDCTYVEGMRWVRPAGTVGFMTYYIGCACGREYSTEKQRKKNAKNYRNSTNRFRRTQ